MSGETILIVDDEEPIREVIRTTLELAGYACLEAKDARTARATLVDHRPDLMLLDWMMPETSGVELLRMLRKDELTRDLPVIMLTAKTDEDNQVQGLDTGADDYVTKPFSNKELLARIRALLRRAGDASVEAIEAKGLKLDAAAHRVFADGKQLNMGPTEFKLLRFFMSNPERVYSREQLLDQVWGSNVYVEERTVDVHIRRLRVALGESYGGFVQTVRGAGYRFSPVIAG